MSNEQTIPRPMPTQCSDCGAPVFIGVDVHPAHGNPKDEGGRVQFLCGGHTERKPGGAAWNPPYVCAWRKKPFVAPDGSSGRYA